MEAHILLDCSNFSDNLVDVIEKFQQIGWKLSDAGGKSEFLPLGKNDFEWITKDIAEYELFETVRKKAECKETVGVHLFYSNGVEGISFLAEKTNSITLGLSINRKIAINRHTDFPWYFENLIAKLWNAGVEPWRCTMEEIDD